MKHLLNFKHFLCLTLLIGLLSNVPLQAQISLGDNLSISGPSPGADGSGKASGTSYGNVIDGNTSSIWGATGTSNQNIAVKWGSPVTANTVIIREVGNNITSWRLETEGGSTLATGTTAGPEKLIQFESATEKKFRFVILSASANPQISEFEVYNATGGSDGGTTTYQLNTSVNGQGSVSPSSGTFNEGETVSLTASPASGWRFSGWGGDASGTGNPLILTMNGNKSVTANFTEIPEECTVVSLQAEDGTFSSGSIDSNHTGYTGSGFVNTNNAIGEWLDISVNAASSGSAAITVRYADGKTDERSVSVSVNGNEVIPYLDMPATGAWSNWDVAAFTVNLNGGNNVIRLTALNSGGLPNIDKADACIAGGGSTDPDPVYYQLSTSVNGNGTVDPSNGTYQEGSSVTLTATPASGWEFSGWSGSASGTSNPLTITMDSNKNITASFTETSTPPPGDMDNSLVGYATLAGGTTGGAGGTSVTVSTGLELQAAIKNKGSQPLTIYVNGTITTSNSSGLTKIDVKDVSDISILGAGAGAEFIGIGIKVTRASNIIIRNLKIHHVAIGDKDCISIEGPADHVWVDHCELYNEYQGVGKDYYDGLLDAKGESDYITFSWNYLHDSWKASLSGSSDSDSYARKITYHHNYFENINSRLPLFRFGQGHIFNNFYKDVESTAINSRMGACVKIENNYFQNVQNPYVTAYSSEDGYGDISGNELVNSPFEYSSSVRPLPSCTANIPYAYSNVLHGASEVPAVVVANAGVGKIDVMASTTANANFKDKAALKLIDQQERAFNFHPNPYQGFAIFELNLIKKGKVAISLYNLQGNRIALITDQLMKAGKNEIRYENTSLQPGMYFFLIETEEGSFRRKVLVK